MALTDFQERVASVPSALDDLVATAAGRLDDAASVADSMKETVTARAIEMGDRVDRVVDAVPLRDARRRRMLRQLAIVVATVAVVIVASRTVVAVRRRRNVAHESEPAPDGSPTRNSVHTSTTKESGRR